jgi:3-hydroxyethyl bacteriochlorophyllide a dehydrogenase
MDTLAVVMEQPERLALTRLTLDAPQAADIVVDVAFSGVSTGTERLLWSGRMPNFPGMGYPLVPGYESVGQILEAGPESGRKVGETVFVPGARCFGDVRGLFGGAAHRVVLPGQRAIPIDAALGEAGALIALAATARHAIASGDGQNPELIIGHGVLGRLLARIAVAVGAEPVVWETNPARQGGAEGYRVVHPDDDPRRDYRAIYDVSGDPALLDTLIGRLARGGEVVLAGFYEQALSFAFPPAFMKEARLRVAAEWQPSDLAATKALIEEGFLSLDGLITHHMPAMEADAAYRTAFGDPACLKMILDWRTAA